MDSNEQKRERGSELIEIKVAETEADVSVARELISEFARWLAVDLSFQDFEHELEALPGKYSPPRGRLFIAYAGSEPVGCVALRPLADDICEMKRLYVRPSFQGTGLGKKLAEKIIEEARRMGYRAMRLDTIAPKMQAAVKLYRALGFKEIEPYTVNPISGVIFMELNLAQDSYLVAEGERS